VAGSLHSGVIVYESDYLFTIAEVAAAFFPARFGAPVMVVGVS